ncbi:MAG: transferrin-binding protein-like solute binding protein [Sphingomicrobium sp.]
MPHVSKMMVASSIALAIGLSGCVGTTVASIGPPTPTPTPTPTPSAATVGAPALADVQNGNVFPIATTGGPTIALHDATTFPLLESVMTINPAGAVADSATINAGATLTSSYGPDDYQGGGGASYTIDIDNPAIGISDQVFNSRNSGSGFSYSAAAGDKTVTMAIKDPSNSNLSWTTYGTWAVHVDVGTPSTTTAAFVTGYKTPTASVPATGYATYNGSVVGQVIYPKAGAENGVGLADLTGSATLQANFASGGVTGELTGMMAGSAPWNSVTLAGSIAGGQNSFSGTSAATSAPNNSTALSGSATGTFAGMFFGPTAQELGAVWTLSDGTASAIGSIGATNSGCVNSTPWDYC